MEKLMKYVEEMQKEGINVCRPGFKEDYLVEMMLISKHYPLIKWLVDNDKIDDDKLEVAYENEEDLYIGGDVYRDYRFILMLLSIQDEPIEFLCSILK